MFGACLAACHASLCFADEKTERFRFLVAGMKFEREKIISGVVRGKGERTLMQEIDGKSVTATAPVEYLLAFDFLENKMRVDRKEPSFDKAGGYNHHLGQYIETHDSIVYSDYTPHESYTDIIIIVSPKDGDYEWRGNDYCHPLDIRNIGFLDLWRFTHGNSPSFTDRMATYTRIPEVLVEEGNGVVRYEYHQRVKEGGQLRRSVLWVDTKNGFTLIRSLSIWEFDFRKDHPWILSDTRISWKKHVEGWVPVDIVFEKNLPIEENEKLVMSFDWESLNKPIDDEYFDYCDFAVSSTQTPVVKIPTKAQAAEGRSGGRVGVYGDLCGTKEGRLLMKQIAAKESSRKFWQRTFLIAGIVLIVIGISLKIIKAMRRRS
jgi:hypothetical protein